MSDTNLKEIFNKNKNKIKIFYKNFGRIFLILFFTFLFILSIFIFQKISSTKNLKIIFFDIGQGDSALIQTPTGENILIDAGPSNLILKKISDSFSIFDRKIDLAILSHPDSDHVAGFISVFQNYDIKNILENSDNNKESEIYTEIKNEISKQKEKNNSQEYFANCGDEIYFSKNQNQDDGNEIDDQENILIPKFFIIHPKQNDLIVNDTNDNSIVTLLVYGDYGFLFTGDASQNVEKKLFFEIENCFNKNDSDFIKNNLKKLTVLKVSHHGSTSGSGEDFIKKIKPNYSVISAGKNNRFGHPKEETLKILEKYSKNILNTINDGDIIFTTDGKNFEVETSK